MNILFFSVSAGGCPQMENRLESSNKKAVCPFLRNILLLIAISGGERGIRTLGEVSPSQV